MTTIQAPLIPRPIMRLASLVLAGMAIIIIVSTIRDFWQATPTNSPGLYERSQATIEVDPKQDEIPFVLATYRHDANLELDAIWAERQNGLTPMNPVPGRAPCAEPTGFRTGSGEVHTDIHQHVGRWAVGGYSTGSGIKGTP